MSADRPPAPVDPGHSLTSILRSHAKAADRDSELAEHRDDDAALEPGPPRTPSAGLPLEPDADAEPFTPPVPSIQTLRGLLSDGLHEPAMSTHASRASRLSALASMPVAARIPRPSRRAGGLGVVVIVVLLVAGLDGAQRSTPPQEATAPPSAALTGRTERTPATSPKRRRFSNGSRPTSRARVPTTRRPARPPNTVARPMAGAAQVPQPIAPPHAAAPATPAAPPGGSRFTSEFTP